MTGVPPLAGFLGKFYLFSAAVHNRLYYLTVIAVLNSVVSAYYYLRVLVIMYMQPAPAGAEAGRVERDVTLTLVGATAAVMTVMLGLFPSRFLDMVVDAFRQAL